MFLGDISELFQLEVGRWTPKPVDTDEGRLLMLVESKAPGVTPEFAAIRPRVRRHYRDEKRLEEFDRLEQELKRRYNVSIREAKDASE